MYVPMLRKKTFKKKNKGKGKKQQQDDSVENKIQCKYCGKTNHVTDQCFKLERDVKAQKEAKTKESNSQTIDKQSQQLDLTDNSTVKAAMVMPLIQSGQAKLKKHQLLIQKISLQKIQRTSRCL